MSATGQGFARPNRTWVYRLYSWSGLLLYVGCTNDVDRRLKEHRTRSPWYALADNARTTWFDGPAAAHQAERDAIRTEHPLFNRVSFRQLPPSPQSSPTTGRNRIADAVYLTRCDPEALAAVATDDDHADLEALTDWCFQFIQAIKEQTA